MNTPTYRAYLRLPPQRVTEKTTTPHLDLAVEAWRRIVDAHRGETGAASLTCDGRNLEYLDLRTAPEPERLEAPHPDTQTTIPDAGMTWADLTAARDRLGLTNRRMAALLGVALSTYEGWGVRGKIPQYIQCSVEAHLALSPAMIRTLLAARDSG